MKFTILSAIAASLLTVVPALAVTVAYGNNTSSFGDCTPGCTPVVQTAYDSSLFSGAGYVNSVTLFLQSFSSVPISFYLSTTPTGVGAMSPTFAANQGADFNLFGSSVLAPNSSGAVTITGSFFYNPALGDLLLETNNPNQSLYSAYSGDLAAERVYSFGDTATGYVGGPGYAYTARFDFTSSPASGAVPEPSTWAMMLVGFGAIGFAMRRKQRQTVRLNFA